GNGGRGRDHPAARSGPRLPAQRRRRLREKRARVRPRLQFAPARPAATQTQGPAAAHRARPVTDWEPFAHDLARQITHPTSRWRPAVEVTPRHVFVPAWWVRERDQWRRRDAEADLPGAYEDTSLVTRVGTLHADHADPDDAAEGRSTSSSTQPSLLLKMYRHALLDHYMDVLEVGTG